MTDTVSNQRTVLTVRDPLAVDMLLNLTAARRIGPFMRGPQTLGTAAAELSVPASSLAYWVARFQRVGLLEVVEVRRRAGKPIPVYRATASEYRIPLEAMPAGAREEFLHGGRRHMFEQLVESVEKAGRRHFQGGLRIRTHPDRGLELGFDEPDRIAEGRAPVTEWWGTVTLTDAEAAAFHEELEDLIARYGHDTEAPGTKPYIFVTALSPTHRPTKRRR